MAFVKKTWKDRVVQYANRRLLTKSGGEIEQVVVTRDEGTVTEAGDKFDAATMNDLEDRLEYAFDNVSTAIECTQAQYDTWKNAGQLKPQTSYIITDAPNLNPTASDIEYSSGVTVKDELDKASVYNQNGIFITKVGHSYLATFSSAKISDVYTVLDDYNPSGVFLNVVWNSDTAKANVVRISSGTVTVLDTNPWSAITSTDTTKIQGSLAWND